MSSASRSRLACLAVLLVAPALISTAARGQGAYTDHPEPIGEPAMTVVTALIDAVNADDPTVFIRFLETHATASFRDGAPEAEHVRIYREVWGETRGLDYYGYRTYDTPRAADEHVVIVKSRLAGEWRAFVIGMDEDEPSKIAMLRFAQARRPSTLPPEPALRIRGAMMAFDGYVSRLAEADAFSGTVLIAKDGVILYERAFGLASKRFGASNDIDTKFNLGSMNKMFTAVAIMRLVDAGKLSLDDPLSRYVDETWLPASITDRILIRHMLNHTSGLGSYFNETFWESSRARFRDLDDYKPLIRDETLAFDPGAGWQYSNTAFFLLGVVIEKVTGESYFDHVRSAIFVPSGMGGTDSYEMDRPVENLAIGYVPEYDDAGERTWRNNLYMHVIKGGPAGGGFSTVHDLLKFDVALREGGLLTPEKRDQVWQSQPGANSPDYGYGFAVEAGPLGRVVGHGGGFPGLNGQLDMYLDTGYTVAVLSNYDGAAAPIAQKAAELLARVKR